MCSERHHHPWWGERRYPRTATTYPAHTTQIASADVENALYADHRVSEAVAIAVPDKRLGEKVGTIVSLRAGFENVTEEDLRETVKPR